MAEQKIFAGPRIRRIRAARTLTQSAMAQALAISPSYLNLIERNQRPLTVQLLMRLSSVYGIDPAELHGDAGGMIAALREVFADPLLAADLPAVGTVDELAVLTDQAPNAANAIVKLHRALVESRRRLSDLAAMMATDGATAAAVAGVTLPSDEVHDVLARRANHVPALEGEAEAFHRHLAPGDDLAGALKAWLKSQHGIVVRTLPVSAMPLWRRRYDRHSQRLFLSERLSPQDQLREIAMEAVLLRMQVAVDAEIAALRLSGAEARRIARFELARYGAHALMMPYQPFLEAARRVRYDVDALKARFAVSFEQAANRLTMLQRTGAEGVPFFMLEVDPAGNRFRRAGARGYPHARFGGACPKLPVHAAFGQAGQVLVEAVEMPDGAEFLVIARTLEGPQGAFHERPRRTALLLGCDIAHRAEVVYGDALAAGQPGLSGRPKLPATPIGPACRLCERVGCLARAEPPVTRPLGLDEMVTGLSAFDQG